MAKDGAELKVYKFWGNMGGDPAFLMTPPWIQGKLNSVVGDTGVYEVDFGDTHYKTTFYIESISDTVTIPAGTFNNCIRVRLLREKIQGGITEYDYDKHWLAPDIGPVIYRDYTVNWGSIDFSQELVSFSNIGHINIDVNTNQDEYEVNDTLKAYVSIYNSGSCEMLNIYIALQLTDGTLLFYPNYSTDVHPALPNSVNICGSPFVSDYLLFEYTIPDNLDKGTYTLYSALTSRGIDSSDWLSFDKASFNIN
jgi:hypothetical protein